MTRSSGENPIQPMVAAQLADGGPPATHNPRVAELHFDLLVKHWAVAAEKQAQYGRLLVGTLCVIHSAAIFGTLNSTQRLSELNRLGAAACFLVGLLAALIAGNFALLNWLATRELYIEWADPLMIFDAARYPSYETEKAGQLNNR